MRIPVNAHVVVGGRMGMLAARNARRQRNDKFFFNCPIRAMMTFHRATSGALQKSGGAGLIDKTNFPSFSGGIPLILLIPPK
jgi:hypothetical protein